ncbi:hypothetical protein CK203_076709 [Vitis vinifera]|uniref:Uncharacterized protein n=1 Tax=Vitis vinifera TaxID=29760 RepID=A0A438EPE5_VITVI|nr:hypothetical protein CK203_076709 [Vitis vinifera]
MDDLFRRVSKYSMLENDVQATTQQILVAGQASKSDAEISAKLPDRPRSSDRRQEEQNHPELLPLTPLSISYEKFLPMIQDMSDFKWPGPLRADPSKRDHSKKCVYHKEHGHTTATCRSLHYLVKKLTRAGHLKQYIRSDARGRDASQNHNSRTARTPHGYCSSTATPSSCPWRWETLNVLPVQAGPVTLNVQFSVVQDLSPFNVILGRTWLYYMKAILSTYHQMVSFLTEDGQIDLYGSQLVARQCYQIARKVRTSQEDKPLIESTHALDQ